MKTLESAAVLQSIVERISRITPDRTARWGRMNAHQMLCHLTDSFQVPMGVQEGENGNRNSSTHGDEVCRRSTFRFSGRKGLPQFPRSINWLAARPRRILNPIAQS